MVWHLGLGLQFLSIWPPLFSIQSRNCCPRDLEFFFAMVTASIEAQSTWSPFNFLKPHLMFNALYLFINQLKAPILEIKCANQVLNYFSYFLGERLMDFLCWLGLVFQCICHKTNDIAKPFAEWKLALTRPIFRSDLCKTLFVSLTEQTSFQAVISKSSSMGATGK